MPRPVPPRRLPAALLLVCALLVGATACDSGNDKQMVSSDASIVAPTATAEKQRLAKTRFVANAGLAAGAAYQWIVKPYRAGKFKKGADGRTFAVTKAGLAGGFAYNRLKAAADNAKADPLLSQAVAPLAAGIESLKELATKFRKGQAGDSDIGTLEDIIGGVKDAGKNAGAQVTNQVPSVSQLAG
ncbi:hypothetical protein [Streptomyces sp. NPDC002690]